MASWPRGADAAGWGLAAVLIAAISAVAIALGLMHPDPDFPSAELTQSAVWVVVMTPSLAAALGIALWTARRGEARLASWMMVGCATVAAYWLAPALGTTLIADGGTGTAAFAVALGVGTAAWTTVLAVLQLAALAAARSVVGAPVARGSAWFVIAAMAVPILVGVLLPFPQSLDIFPAMPTLLPEQVLRNPVVQAFSGTALYVWMASLFLAPIALWTRALRSSGVRRRALVRIAIGAMLPAMIVVLCGLLAAVDWAGGRAEIGGLAVGFSLGLPLTLAWLAATVRDAQRVSARLTSIGSVVRVLLWGLYVFGMIQLLTPLAGLLGGTAAAGAFMTAAVLAATFLPWRMLVGWCARKADPRAAVAAAAISENRRGDPGTVAQQALRDALGDPDAVLRIRIDTEPEPVWVDASGAPVDAPAADAGSDAVALAGAHGHPRAVLSSRSRFINARPLLEAVRPLIERAALQAEVRAQGERVAAERRRADNAAAEARRRIERDLHDGVQGRLVSLGLGLSLARDGLPDPVARGLIDETVGQLRDAVAELRELSSGELSARLSGTGLASAVGELVRRMPVDVQLDITPVRIAGDIEAVAYFVIAEALTNAVKHAAPNRVRVRVSAGAEVVVSVADDGSGGADLRAGSGLRGLQERVHAVGGRLLVSEGIPTGTLVEAVLPCAS